MKSLKKVRFLSHLGARPSVTLFVLGALGSSLLSGFAYTPKNLVVATVHVGRLPSSLVVSPDSSLVYVGNEDSGSISGIDAATNKVAFTIGVSGDPFYLAITPDGTKLYSTCLAPMPIWSSRPSPGNSSRVTVPAHRPVLRL
jgi:YVTN family beta-propeller protein